MTSDDGGITWELRKAAVKYPWIDVCWSPDLALFVAVANFGTNRVMYSPDGIEWTAVPAAEANKWHSVCWSSDLSLFCAVAVSGTNRVMTCPDPRTTAWTARAHATGEDNSWRGVCWSSGLTLFVAVSSDGTNRVMTSPDGTTWTAQAAAADNSWYSVCWSPELALFCAVASDGTDRIMTSANGTSWTARSYTNSSTSSFWNVCWSAEAQLFCAISSTGTYRIATSPDGINWTGREMTGDTLWHAVCWADDWKRFVAVAYTTSGVESIETCDVDITDPSYYISVYGQEVASGGDQYYKDYDGTLTAVSTTDTAIGIKPGRPPKGSFGCVSETRFFLAGDPDNLGYMWYSNVNTILDWSTSAGGGYISAVDDNSNSYSIGALVPLYGDIYIIGREQQPYLSKLSGSSPSDWTIPASHQYINTTHKTAIALPNDIWFTSNVSTHNIQGVQEYGDIRMASPGDTIKNKIITYFSTSAFASFNPENSQYILKLSGYDNILVCHTSNPIIYNNGIKHYVWTEYKIKDLTPSAFASFNGYFYIGCTDGHLYRLDNTIVTDSGTLPDVEYESGVLTMPMGAFNAKQQYIGVVSTATASATLSLYKNGSSSAFWNQSLAIDDDIIQDRVNFACRALKLKLHTFTYTEEVVIQNLIFGSTPIKFLTGM
jgi:hypothetical protein